MKITVFILTSLIQIAAAAAGFLLLLLGMNGYNDRQSTPGLALYIVLALGSALLLGLASAFMAKRLVERRSFGSVAASITAVFSSLVVGGLILIAGFFAAIALAEIMRGMK